MSVTTVVSCASAAPAGVEPAPPERVETSEPTIVPTTRQIASTDEEIAALVESIDSSDGVTEFPTAVYDSTPRSPRIERFDAAGADAGLDVEVAEAIPLDDFVAETPVILHVRVVAAGDAMSFEAKDLPQSFETETGVTDPAVIGFDGVAVELEVLEAVKSDVALGTHVMAFEIGCWAEGAVASITPDIELLAFGDFVAQGSGPVEGSMQTLFFSDWSSARPEGRLRNRESVFGSPSSLGDLRRLTIDEAIARIEEISAG